MLKVSITQVFVLTKGVQVTVDLIGFKIQWRLLEVEADLGNGPGIAENGTLRITLDDDLMFIFANMICKSGDPGFGPCN